MSAVVLPGVRVVNTIRIWTDGSAVPARTVKPGEAHRGGWAFVLRYKEHSRQHYGADVQNPTIGRMELLAIKQALAFVRLSEEPLVIYSDSKYALACITAERQMLWQRDGWKTATGEDVKHKELIQEICALLALHRKFRKVQFRHVKGHTGVPENEIADRLASLARKAGIGSNYIPVIQADKAG